MGAGLAGGPLTGGLTTAALPPAPAGQSAVLSGPLGAGATDVVTKAGSTVADASVNAGAKLFSIRTGIGGTEVEYASFTKASAVLAGTLALPTGVAGQISVGLSQLYANNVDGVWHFRYNAGASRVDLNADTGRIDQSGTDSSGTPGAATIDKPSGKSAIALGAASVVITNALVTAASLVFITAQTRDATCVQLIAVPGAGSFTVSGTAVATADLLFSWHVQNIL